MEVSGRYSNHADQGERIDAVLNAIEIGPKRRKRSTRKRILRKLSPPEVDDLRDAYLAGASTYSLANAFGIHRHTIAAHLRNNRVEMRGRALTPEEVEEAAALYSSGLSLADVAARIGRQRTGVANALRKAGVQLRPRPGWHY